MCVCVCVCVWAPDRCGWQEVAVHLQGLGSPPGLSAKCLASPGPHQLLGWQGPAAQDAGILGPLLWLEGSGQRNGRPLPGGGSWGPTSLSPDCLPDGGAPGAGWRFPPTRGTARGQAEPGLQNVNSVQEKARGGRALVMICRPRGPRQTEPTPQPGTTGIPGRPRLPESVQVWGWT